MISILEFLIGYKTGKGGDLRNRLIIARPGWEWTLPVWERREVEVIERDEERYRWVTKRHPHDLQIYDWLLHRSTPKL